MVPFSEAYFLFKKMNTSQDFKQKVSKKSPSSGKFITNPLNIVEYME